MASAWASAGGWRTLTRCASVQWKAFAAASPEVVSNVAVSIGSSSRDFDNLCAVRSPPGLVRAQQLRLTWRGHVLHCAAAQIMAAVPAVDFICLDVANGYSEAFVGAVRKVREKFPRKTIIAGNVVTGACA